MKRWIATALIVPFTLIGCADKEMMQEYYQVEAARTQAIIESIEHQTQQNASNRTLQMQTFSSAATNAAATESPVDDALLAFAWGYQMGTPQQIEIPKLQSIKAPDSSADLVRAWTPLVGLAMPFLYPLAYGWASSDAGTRISADNGATVALDSGNAGSYNRAGYDMTTTIDNTGNLGVENHQESSLLGEEEGPDVEGETLPEEECTNEFLSDCIANPPAGFSNAGTPLIAPGCSCNSFCNGECS